MVLKHDGKIGLVGEGRGCARWVCEVVKIFLVQHQITTQSSGSCRACSSVVYAG